MVFAAVLLPNHSIGKSLRPQHPNKRGFTANEPEATHAANETPSVRNKRHPCSYPRQSPPSSNGCLETTFYSPKYGTMEAVCKTGSFSCLDRIATSLGRYPGCTAVYGSKRITFDNGTSIDYRFITDCECA